MGAARALADRGVVGDGHRSMSSWTRFPPATVGRGDGFLAWAAGHTLRPGWREPYIGKARSIFHDRCGIWPTACKDNTVIRVSPRGSDVGCGALHVVR